MQPYNEEWLDGISPYALYRQARVEQELDDSDARDTLEMAHQFAQIKCLPEKRKPEEWFEGFIRHIRREDVAKASAFLSQWVEEHPAAWSRMEARAAITPTELRPDGA